MSPLVRRVDTVASCKLETCLCVNVAYEYLFVRNRNTMNSYEYGFFFEEEDSIGAATFANIRAVLKDRTDRDVAYQLAGQLATTELAEEAGYLSDDTMIFAPVLTDFADDPEEPLFGHVSPTGVVSLGELTHAANDELRAHPSADVHDPWWSYQNTLAQVLEGVNRDAILLIGW